MECDRRIFVKGLGGAILAFSSFLQACNRLSGEVPSKKEKMQTVQAAQIATGLGKPVPPIDAAAPTRSETATFALG